MPENNVLLKVDKLVKHFPIYQGVFRRQVGAVHAVDGISFDVRSGETFGLVGESGCGKTTAGRTIIQLYKATAGNVHFGGTDLTKVKGGDLRRIRRRMQMIFQDPYASLNPRMSINDIVGEPLLIHGVSRGKETRQRVENLLEIVQLNPGFAARFPHEFSGGQRQRIAIARALAVRPKLIVCDEPTSALDVSVQAQILNLLRELQGELGLSYLFITHNIGVVEYIADQVAVMRAGAIVERGDSQAVLGSPQHDYTRALLAAVPRIARP